MKPPLSLGEQWTPDNRAPEGAWREVDPGEARASRRAKPAKRPCTTQRPPDHEGAAALARRAVDAEQPRSGRGVAKSWSRRSRTNCEHWTTKMRTAPSYQMKRGASLRGSKRQTTNQRDHGKPSPQPRRLEERAAPRRGQPLQRRERTQRGTAREDGRREGTLATKAQKRPAGLRPAGQASPQAEKLEEAVDGDGESADSSGSAAEGMCARPALHEEAGREHEEERNRSGRRSAGQRAAHRCRFSEKNEEGSLCHETMKRSRRKTPPRHLRCCLQLITLENCQQAGAFRVTINCGAAPRALSPPDGEDSHADTCYVCPSLTRGWRT